MFRIKKATTPDFPLDLEPQEMSDIVITGDEAQSAINGLFLEWTTRKSNVFRNQQSPIRPPGMMMMFRVDHGCFIIIIRVRNKIMQVAWEILASITLPSILIQAMFL
jgi:hypothetical protein